MKKKWLCLALVGCVVSLASASGLSDSQSGFYLGGGSGPWLHAVPAGSASDDFEFGVGSWSASAFAGYQFNSFFAIQAGYDYFDSVSDTGADPDHYYLMGGDVLLKGLYPLCSWFVLNGFAGVSVINENDYNVEPWGQVAVDSNVTNAMPTIGAGFSVYFTQYVSVDTSVRYLIKVGDINDIFEMPVSLTIHF